VFANDFRRFNGKGESAAPPSIIVVQNWTEELKHLVPTNR
jgi:hypothetical protein